jgi:maltose O-acetyltransferase
MANLNYLWKQRAKYSVKTIQFYKAWAKRLLCMPELIRRNKRRNRLVSKGALIDSTAEIGEVDVAGAKMNLKIGAFTFLGKVHIALHDKVVIGNNVCINDGVQLLTASHDVMDPKWNHVKAEIIIEDYVWIATNAIILPGVRIGKGAVVGAGAVVSKDILSGQIVAGNPAKPISKKRCEELNYNPCEFLAGNKAWLVG